MKYVYVDSNEAATAKKVYGELSKLVPTKVVDMHGGKGCADYFIPPFIFERKSAGDFLRSIRDGSLFNQVRRMKDVPSASVFVLVEGFAKALKFSKWSLQSVSGVLWSLVYDWKVQLLWTCSTHHSAVMLATIFKDLVKADEYRLIPMRVKPSKLSLSERQRFIVEGYEKVGPVSAIKLLEKFGSVCDIMSASTDELADAGLGRGVAEKMFEVNTSKFKPK